MSFAEIETRVHEAIEQLRHKDPDLMEYDDLEHRLPERAISHRFAMYLEPPLVEGCKIDCDYNKFEQGGVKRPQNEPDDRFAPDIIMHHRKIVHITYLQSSSKQFEMKRELQSRRDEVQKDERSLIELTKPGRYAYT